MVPSVAMNGSMLPAVVTRPLARPQTAPMTMASAIATTSIVAGSAITPLFMNMIVRLATNATMEPTDRSRPPADITKVAPTAMMAMKALRVMTLSRLSMLMKFGFAIAPSIRRRASARKGATARRSMSFQDFCTFRLSAARSVIFDPLCGLPRFDAGRQHDDLVLVHVLACYRADDPPRPHDHDAVANSDQFLHLGRDDDDRAPLRGEYHDELVDLFLGADVDTTRRLVDNNDGGISHHHFGQQQLLLVAARKLAGKHVLAAGADVELADRLVERDALLRPVDLKPAP